MSERRGMVQVFLGNGRIETSAALGTAMRSVGYSLKVLVVFFKNDNNKSLAEKAILDQLNGLDSEILCLNDGIMPRTIEALAEDVEAGVYNLIILDQVLTPAAQLFIGDERLLEMVKMKHDQAELILTGSYAEEPLIEASDLVTKFECEAVASSSDEKTVAECE